MMLLKHAFILIILLVFFQESDALPDSAIVKAVDGEYRGEYLGQKPPGDVPVLFAPGVVSTGKEHSAAMFTPDGKEMWFGRMFPAEVYFMTIVNGVWTQPERAPFSGDHNDLYPVLSGDGNTILFSSIRPVTKGGKPLNRSEGDMWKVVRSESNWSEPMHLGEKVNFGSRHAPGSLSANGEIYYTVFMKNSSADLYLSEFDGKDYKSPVPLIELNSSEPEHSPFIARDGSYILFSSFRRSMGRSDLFISFQLEDGGWSNPINIGNRINSKWKDEYPHVTPDGKYLFFNSNRPSEINDRPIPDGPGNIYWVETGFIDRLRSQAHE